MKEFILRRENDYYAGNGNWTHERGQAWRFMSRYAAKEEIFRRQMDKTRVSIERAS